MFGFSSIKISMLLYIIMYIYSFFVCVSKCMINLEKHFMCIRMFVISSCLIKGTLSHNYITDMFCYPFCKKYTSFSKQF